MSRFTHSQDIPLQTGSIQFYKRENLWAQLSKDRLALNPGLNLTQISFSCVQKALSRIIFSVIFKAFKSEFESCTNNGLS